MTNLQKTVYCAVAGTFTAGAGIACIIDGVKLYHAANEKAACDAVEDPKPELKARINRFLLGTANYGLSMLAMGTGVAGIEFGKMFFKTYAMLLTTKQENQTVENPTETNSENN